MTPDGLSCKFTFVTLSVIPGVVSKSVENYIPKYSCCEVICNLVGKSSILKGPQNGLELNDTSRVNNNIYYICWCSLVILLVLEYINPYPCRVWGAFAIGIFALLHIDYRHNMYNLRHWEVQSGTTQILFKVPSRWYGKSQEITKGRRGCWIITGYYRKSRENHGESQESAMNFFSQIMFPSF